MNDQELNKLKTKAYQIRCNILEMVGVGRAGHLGGSSSLAEILAVLYFHKMKLDPNNPKAESRDRLILSKGHAVLGQYAALAELGYIPKAELKNIKTINGMLQGHPDMDNTPGIEAVTGSLGQGLSVAVGMALGLRLDKKASRVYVILGDGELSEGQIWEAAMAAANFQVDNLTAILDRNRYQATGATQEVFNIPSLQEKWSAFGWHCLEIDGHDIAAISDALDMTGAIKNKPVMIIANTVKGKGFSFAENTAAFHNGILTEELYQTALNDLEKMKNEGGDIHGHN